MEDRTFGVKGFAVSVTGSSGIEEVIEIELLGWSHRRLTFNQDDLVVVDGIADDFKVIGGDVREIDVAKFGSKVDFRVCRDFEWMNGNSARGRDCHFPSSWIDVYRKCLYLCILMVRNCGYR